MPVVKMVRPYSAVSSPSDRSKRLTLRTLADLFILTNYSLKNIHSNLSQLSVVMCSFMELSELGYRGENENARVLKRLLPLNWDLVLLLSYTFLLYFLVACTCILLSFIINSRLGILIELTMWLAVWPCGNRLLERLMSPSPKSQVMFASAFSCIGDFFRIFGIHGF